MEGAGGGGVGWGWGEGARRGLRRGAAISGVGVTGEGIKRWGTEGIRMGTSDRFSRGRGEYAYESYIYIYVCVYMYIYIYIMIYTRIWFMMQDA